jgi:zinc transporter ZupT
LIDSAVHVVIQVRVGDEVDTPVAPFPQADAEEADVKKTNVAGSTTKARLIAGVLIGDFFHNLCDGFFLGAAFKGCGDSFGWGVALSTVLHEFPQELADYAILTGPAVSMSPAKALVMNFLSGLSVILGVIIICATDVDDAGIGLLLAFGGGVYLHIGATECMPQIYSAGLSARIRVACIISFILGAVLIGLVLLDHEHCIPSTPGIDSGGESGGGHHHL